jgi:hypothetical protein
MKRLRTLKYFQILKNKIKKLKNKHPKAVVFLFKVYPGHSCISNLAGEYRTFKLLNFDFNADPDPCLHFSYVDPDPAFKNNADPDPASINNADPDPAFKNNGDPDPASINNADPDPASKNNADTDPASKNNPDPDPASKKIMRIRILNPGQQLV